MRDNLLSFGYDTLTIDEGWAESPPGNLLIDANGRPTWNNASFPHGIPWLVSQLREMGITLGLWIVRGVPREAVARALPIANGGGLTCADASRRDRNCSWSACAYGSSWPAPAAVGYYASLAALYVEWGVGFAKVDCLWPNKYEGTPQTYFDEDVHGITDAFKGTGVTLSLSPGISVSPANASFLAAGSRAALYRIAEDVLDGVCRRA